MKVNFVLSLILIIILILPVNITATVLDSKTELDTIFEDLDDFMWAKESIYFLYDSYSKSILIEKSNKFYPDKPIKRADFVADIVRIIGIKDDNLICSFEDVQQQDWFYRELAVAEKKGLIKGDGSGFFRPNDNITRQDAIIVLDNILQIMDTGYTPTLMNESFMFKDDGEIDKYAKRSIYLLKKLEILNGYNDSTFLPKKSLNRAEACVLVVNTLNYLYFV